jgi:hypothetical protein
MELRGNGGDDQAGGLGDEPQPRDDLEREEPKAAEAPAVESVEQVVVRPPGDERPLRELLADPELRLAWGAASERDGGVLNEQVSDSDTEATQLADSEAILEGFRLPPREVVPSKDGQDSVGDLDVPDYRIGAKIALQMERRGWTIDDIGQVISNAARAVETRDTRWLPNGSRNNDPATAYIQPHGHYVVVNDRTRDIVQISDRTDPNWVAPWDECGS